MWVKNLVKNGLNSDDRDSPGQTQEPDALNPSSVSADNSVTLSK